MIEPARTDHTKPTLAFIALSIAAAVVLAAGMTDRPGDVVAAAEVPTGTPAPVVVERPDAEPTRSMPGRFSIADVVTLAGIQRDEDERRERRDRIQTAPAEFSSAGAAPVTSGGSSTGSSGGGGSSSSGGGAGSGAGDGTASGSGGGSGSGSAPTTSGPGRSETGRGEARGQRDGTPGRADRTSKGSSDRSARR
jgi:hypothetical protein